MNNKYIMIVGLFFCSIGVLHAKADDHMDLLSELRQPWHRIQKDAYGSVVQIVGQRAEMDILHPWAPPIQMEVKGSGFFINEQGEILTNAHVVDQALVIWVRIPSLGKHLITVELVGVCPERDIALLRIPDNELEFVKEKLKEKLKQIIPLPLGDSDTVYRTDEVLALGYPFGLELKTTSGVISGREQQWIEMDAAINPGSSGGPLLNIHGQVIGINSAGITNAQNIGYIIPINNVKVILPELYKKKFIYKPFLGVLSINVTDDVTDYLGNPQPGGCFVAEVVKDSPLYKAGVQTGDMIYEINGYCLDIFGEMNVPWSEDKVSIIDYVSRIELGQEVALTIYRKGKKLDLTVSFKQSERLPIRMVYPGYEDIDYEIFGGMVVMELTLNHVKELAPQAPGLTRYGEIKNQKEPVLVVTHIFSSSSLCRARTLTPGVTLVEINGQPVSSLEDFRKAVKMGADEKYFVIRASDKVSNISDNLLVVLPYDKIIQEELQLAHHYHYPLSSTAKELLEQKGILPTSS